MTEYDGFEGFYRTHRATAVRWALGILGDRMIAEEAADDALLKIGEILPQLDNPDAYLRRSVVNECRSRYRSRERELARMRRYSTDQPSHIIDDSSAELLDVLDQLSYEQRVTVVLRYWAGWSYSEIAVVLNARTGTVRVIAHRALKVIRQQLTGGLL